jgi:uncharacterized protein (DUF302 family)
LVDSSNSLKKLRSFQMFRLYVLTGIFLFSSIISAQNMPVIESKSSLSFTETVEKLKSSAEEKGWKVPAVHDLQKSLSMNGQEVRPVNIIEICNPEYAADVLNGENTSLSAFMPCRISVYEKDNGDVYISRIDVSAFMSDDESNVAAVTFQKAFNDMEMMIKEVAAED